MLFQDIIINNAGILRDRSFARISDDDWGQLLGFSDCFVFSFLFFFCFVFVWFGFCFVFF